MTDWKAVAQARGVVVGEGDLDRVAPAMETAAAWMKDARKALEIGTLPATGFAPWPYPADGVEEQK